MEMLQNAFVLITSVVIGFMFLGAGGVFMGKLASKVLLPPEEIAARDVTSILLISEGIPGEASIKYTLPPGTPTRRYVNMVFNLEPTKVTFIESDINSKTIFLPSLSYPLTGPLSLRVERGDQLEIKSLAGNIVSVEER